MNPPELQGFDTPTHPAINEARLQIARMLPDPAMPCWVMGGAIRDVLSGHGVRHDLDLFFPDIRAALSMESQIQDAGGALLSGSPRKSKYLLAGAQVDVIYHEWETIENLAQAADFTVASGVFDLKKKRFAGNRDFFADLAMKTLVIQALPNPIKTLARAARYMSIGFRLPYGQAMRLGHHIRDDQESPTKMFDWKEDEERGDKNQQDETGRTLY